MLLKLLMSLKEQWMNVNTECNATGIKALESMAAIAASSNTKDMTGDANKSESYTSSYSAAKNVKNAETDNLESSNMAANAELRAPLAMMDLNEVSIDDMFLSADMYEFDCDFFGPKAFSVELNTTRGVATKGHTSGDWDCAMGPGHCSGMFETSTCLENKQVAEARRASTYACSVAVQCIDINALPRNQIPALGQDNSPPDIDEDVPSAEREPDACKKDKHIVRLYPSLLRATKLHTKKDILQDGPRHTAAEFSSSSPKPCKLPVKRKNRVQPGNIRKGKESESTSCVVLAANSEKFCVAVPPSDQTWLELPRRLPVLPRMKKQARKILILKDPSTRLWPVLYQCTPKFNCFIIGWDDISRENNLREGDACEFELCSNSELSFQVIVPSLQ
ncbi:hypothetical protein GUJ93_ZPchr0001g31939 [Zizania palustris]|uniref:TF-B3 domain-containing protein n=1 Tax=Zizania palustris TaxID=103762 RepID=A0A8J5VC01_ZIZPA|nr:hypothetical protein GUJ93_ZPchr0001g31939 [Zizania palustris]